MFYKNLTFYRIKTPFPHPKDIIILLKKACFAPCLGLDGFSEGLRPSTPTATISLNWQATA